MAPCIGDACVLLGDSKYRRNSSFGRVSVSRMLVSEDIPFPKRSSLHPRTRIRLLDASHEQTWFPSESTSLARGCDDQAVERVLWMVDAIEWM